METAIEVMKNNPQVVLYVILASLSVAIISYWAAWLFEDIGEEFGKVDAESVGIFYLMLPLARKMSPGPWLLKFGPAKQYAAWAERQLSLGGLDLIFTPSDYVGSHFVLLFLGLASPFALFVAMPDIDGRYVVMMSIILGSMLSFFPFYYLHTIIDERKWAIFRGMPYMLDLLTLLVEAGLDFTVALERAATLLGKGPLQSEVKRFIKQLQLGALRKNALSEMGQRSDLMEMRSFVTALIQQQELGTPLGGVLRTQAEIMRFRRMQVAEERANKAPTKILIPMVLFIFPSVFLVLIGPLILRARGETP